MPYLLKLPGFDYVCLTSIKRKVFVGTQNRRLTTVYSSATGLYRDQQHVTGFTAAAHLSPGYDPCWYK